MTRNLNFTSLRNTSEKMAEDAAYGNMLLMGKVQGIFLNKSDISANVSRFVARIAYGIRTQIEY